MRLLADRVGLTVGLSKALARRSFSPVHDRGRVLVDVAVLLADGGEAIADIDVLRHQSAVLGPVASAPTVWRMLDEVTPVAIRRIEKAKARTRRHVWAQLPVLPASKVADTDLGDVVVLDVDATLVTAHSEKEQAAATFKGGFGYHPLGVWCDNTTECLVADLRPGNAGSNTTTDHIEVLGRAIAQIPATFRKRLLIGCDGAGATHGLLDWLTDQNQIRGRTVEYSVGFAITQKIRDAIALVPEQVWTPAMDADGDVRDGGDVAELTGLLDLTGWPEGIRVILRRERPHPGAQLAFLEARHRAHARVEDRIRHVKDSGLGRFPSREFKINQAWATAAAISADLVAWLRLLALTDEAAGDLAKAEPKALRYRLLHVPGPAHPQRTQTTTPDPQVLALGHGHRGRLRQDRRDPRPRLTNTPPPDSTRTLGEPHPAATAGKPSYPPPDPSPSRQLTRPSAPNRRPHE